MIDSCEFYFHVLAALGNHKKLTPVAEKFRDQLRVALWNTDQGEEELLAIVRNTVAENNGMVRLF